MIERFMALFAGLDRAHGTYTLPPGTAEVPGEKVKGKAKTHHAPVTAELWERHLDGAQGLGIVPVRDDATAVFGAIDVDQYRDLDPEALYKKVQEFKLPLVMTRSKSGGLHLWLFVVEPVPAELVRNKLTSWAALLGYAGVEVFPKQTRLANENDVGNWINMPYFNGARTTRYALREGRPVTNVAAFLDYAELMRVMPGELEEIEPPTVEVLPDGPPCLQRLCVEGFPHGSRNNALFDLGVYARQAYPDTWERKVDEYNLTYMSPGSSAEVVQIINSLRKRTYYYRCSEAPINQYCDKLLCRTRKYGIGSAGYRPKLEALTKILFKGSPRWIVTVDGVRIEMSTDDLFTQTRFVKLVADYCNKAVVPVKQSEWCESLQPLMDMREEIEPPPDADVEGVFHHHLEEYLVNSPPARSQSELLQGKPWWDSGRVYFRSPDLLQYLEHVRFAAPPTQVYSWLRGQEVAHHQFKISGRCVQCWSISEPARQTEPYPVPRRDDE